MAAVVQTALPQPPAAKAAVITVRCLGSMARYASFVLQFIYSMHSVVSSIEGFVFAEDLSV